MQRPTTSGRRHNRAGSVTVAELIRNQPTPVRIRTRDLAAATHGLLTGPPTAEVDPAPPGRRTARAAKLAGVVTGAVLLVASIAAASVLAGNRPAGPVEPRVEPPGSITGSSALRPDLLSTRLDSGPGGAAPVQRAAPLAVDAPQAPPIMVPPPQVDVGPEPQVDIVRKFFELLPTRPSDASRLLSPELLGDARDFVESWGHVQAITVESTALRSDGAVLAVVSMQERTGRWMRVEQVFRLTDTSVPRIVSTEVLTAQLH
ncbi:hypothetical protein AB0G02_08610 [Actinosynnema sp. NPDC023658]|uniref:hypothetical protein n=1 Tax=Actinosynnema sp. NPDC023658 TaxID=3155465 RepID=UPI0033F8D8C3